MSKKKGFKCGGVEKLVTILAKELSKKIYRPRNLMLEFLLKNDKRNKGFSSLIKMKKTKGVIYVAIGKKFIDEVLISAASLRKHMPNLSVTLFTNEFVDSVFFDNIVKIKKSSFSKEDKIMYIAKSPYDLTLFLDTDTYICDDISELFDLLNRFDMAVAHFPMEREFNIKGIPKSFVLLDTGIILFKKSLQVKTLFSEWLRLYKLNKKRGGTMLNSGLKNNLKWRTKGIPDALSFNEVIYNSEIKFATLTKEYYFRGKCGFVNWKVKIIHIRRGNFDSIDKIINHFIGSRLYIWKGSRQGRNRLCVIRFKNNKYLNYEKSVGKKGIFSMLVILKKLIKTRG